MELHSGEGVDDQQTNRIKHTVCQMMEQSRQRRRGSAGCVHFEARSGVPFWLHEVSITIDRSSLLTDPETQS